jgi:hypothetical protein
MDFIQMALDEYERADHFRLKLVKRILERRRGHSSSEPRELLYEGAVET